MQSLILTALSLLWLTSMASAQQATRQKNSNTPKGATEVKPAKALLVFLGSKPERRFEQTSEGPIMLPPLPDTTPPRDIYMKKQTSEGKKRTWQKIQIAYNSRPQPQVIPALVHNRLYRVKPSAEDDEDRDYYISLPPAQPGGYQLYCMFPSGEGQKTWKGKPLVGSLDLSNPDFTATNCLVINYSQKTIKTLFHRDIAILKPGEINNHKNFPAGKYIRIAARYPHRDMWIYNTAVKPTKDMLNIYVLYDVNPKTNNGRDVAVLHTFIPRK